MPSVNSTRLRRSGNPEEFATFQHYSKTSNLPPALVIFPGGLVKTVRLHGQRLFSSPFPENLDPLLGTERHQGFRSTSGVTQSTDRSAVRCTQTAYPRGKVFLNPRFGIRRWKAAIWAGPQSRKQAAPETRPLALVSARGNLPMPDPYRVPPVSAFSAPCAVLRDCRKSIITSPAGRWRFASWAVKTKSLSGGSATATAATLLHNIYQMGISHTCHESPRLSGPFQFTWGFRRVTLRPLTTSCASAVYNCRPDALQVNLCRAALSMSMQPLDGSYRWLLAASLLLVAQGIVARIYNSCDVLPAATVRYVFIGFQLFSAHQT